MKLKELIQQKGFTQQQFGELLGVGQTAVSNWCNGTNKASMTNVRKMAQILDVSSDEIMDALV